MKKKNNDKKTKGIGRRELFKISAAASLPFIVGCENITAKQILSEYCRYNNKNRTILPEDYIGYLKNGAFIKGELDNLPKTAIILHDALAEDYLKKLNFTDYRILQTGTTDPNVMYVVKMNQGNDFILNRGLPGAGGIATQAAELYAMGIEYIVHIGTCGLLGNKIKEGEIILSAGSFKDGAAVMLSSEDDENPLAYPSRTLTSELEKTLNEKEIKYQTGIGFTSPIFYFQPRDLIIGIIKGNVFPKKIIPDYIEMENASLFQTAKLMNKHAASMVAGADRYIIEEKIVHGIFDEMDIFDKNITTLKHEYYDIDCDSVKLKMFETAIDIF